MNLGLPELTLILVIILVLFGMAWMVNTKRSSSRSGNTNASSKDRNNEEKT